MATTRRRAQKKTSTNRRANGVRSKGAAASRRRGDAAEAIDDCLGFSLRPWVESAAPSRQGETRSSHTAQIFYFARSDTRLVRSALRSVLLPWQLDHVFKSEQETISFAGKMGPVFVLRPPSVSDPILAKSHEGRLEKPAVARARDQIGAVLASVAAWRTETLRLSFYETSEDEEIAALAGLEIASYSFLETRRARKKRRPRIALAQSRLTKEGRRAAASLGLGVNLARHLTNLPGRDLNPATYAEALRAVFKDLPGMSVEVWSGQRLREERMNLLAAVGGGGAEGPRLVHVRYRPKTGQGLRPIALVGKGVTFDSGGLDLKPSSAMRWMKKDMGGSAAVAGVMLWAARRGLAQPLDAYFALAENAIGAQSFRPGDVITARNGLAVEIHNTDAEGRLVLADALDVAIRDRDEPLAVIDLATLTGAIKIALGADIAGLFSNHDGLAELLEEASRESGELCWRMPLYQPYKGLLKSTFADLANASDGFAGAVTAALFLQQFVGKAPWAHLDIYAWKDGAGGAWSESGGSGQGVQLMARFLEDWCEKGISAWK